MMTDSGLDKQTRDLLDRVALDLRDRGVAPETVSSALVQDAIQRRLDREAALISALFPAIGCPRPPAVEAWLTSLQYELGRRAGAAWANGPQEV